MPVGSYLIVCATQSKWPRFLLVIDVEENEGERGIQGACIHALERQTTLDFESDAEESDRI